MKQQKRGRSIAMTSEERDEFLAGERTCRVGTVNANGQPHVTPLWFVWDGTSLWLNSIVRSQRWTDLQRDRRIALVVDGGTDFYELRGVEIIGSVDFVGEAPRTNVPNAQLTEPELLFARKYTGSGNFRPDGRHGWIRVVPDKVTSWDFRKNPGLKPLP